MARIPNSRVPFAAQSRDGCGAAHVRTRYLVAVAGPDRSGDFFDPGVSQFAATAADVDGQIVSPEGYRREVPVLCRIDTLDELEYFRHGGILNFVLRQLAA